MSTINLLPKDYIEGRLRHRANVLCLAMFIVVMVGVIGAAIVSQRSSRHAEEVDERVRKEYEGAARLIQQMQQLELEKQKLQQKAMAAASLIERVPRSTLLAIVTNSLPKHASLLRFEISTKKRESRKTQNRNSRGARGSKFASVSANRSTGTSPTVVTLKITGLANTDVEVARFIAKMARNPLIKSVDLVYSQETSPDKDKAPVREFQVKAELEPNTDAINLAGTNNRNTGAES